MRLHQLEHQQPVNEHLQLTNNRTIINNADTKQSIEQWYDTAFRTAQQPYWIVDGVITDWQASFNDWLSSISVSKYQLLDNRWRRYAGQLHYIHYLMSQQAFLDNRAAELDATRAALKLELAKAHAEAERVLAGKTTGSNTKK